MSDGYSDAIESYKEAFDLLIEHRVNIEECEGEIESGHHNQDVIRELKFKIGIDAHLFGCISKDFENIFSSSMFTDVIGLHGFAARFFKNKIKVGYELSHEDWLYILHALHRPCELTRFQEAKCYCDKLLVFTDENWQIPTGGISYLDPLRFHDGQQDMLLGIAKLKMVKHGGLLKGQPMMIVANWHYNKRFKFSHVWQPGMIE